MLEVINIPVSAFQVEVDDILRAQGANPEIIRARRPAILEMTEKAIQLGLQKARPMGWIKSVDIQSSRHDRFILADGLVVKGDLLMNQLGGATRIIFAIGTLGMALDQQISASMQEDASFGFTLDTFGSFLAGALSHQLENQIRSDIGTAPAQSVSLALSPGLIGWPVDEGQPQIFKVIQPDPKLVHLSASSQMIPRKSISFIIGIGCPSGSGSPCDFCDLRERCPNRK
jgi:hypothetical protein